MGFAANLATSRADDENSGSDDSNEREEDDEEEAEVDDDRCFDAVVVRVCVTAAKGLEPTHPLQGNTYINILHHIKRACNL